MTRIEHWDTVHSGPLSEPGLRGLLTERGYRVNRYVYEPGAEFPDHRHDVDKIDAVLSGTFEIVLAGQAYVLKAGDWLAISKGVEHSARVLGSEPVVSLDAIRNG